MRFDRIALHCAGFAAAMLSAAVAQAENSPIGVWMDHTGRGAVEITDCNGKLCGRVAWVKDAENAKECGKQIIGNVAPIGKDKWDNGWIYDPDRGSKFDVELTALDNDKLRVKGYAGTKWLSETHTWKRAPAELQKCSTDTVTPATPPAVKPSETAKAQPDGAGSAKPDGSKPDGSVQLQAAKPDSDSSKAAAGKPDVAKTEPAPAPAPQAGEQHDDTAKADPDADENDEPRSGGKGRRFAAQLLDKLESGDGPVQLKRSGKTCRLRAPYVDISFACDRDDD